MAVKIRWFGHAMFRVESPRGIRVVTDPYPRGMGYGPAGAEAEVVTISHEHFDHNAADEVGGDPIVLHGLGPAGQWVRHDRTLTDVHLTAVGGTYHDDRQGTVRGLNCLWRIETGGTRILHLGDLGHIPSPAVMTAAGRVDVLFVPVGGVYTIDAPTANRVVDAFKPRVVIPMHYRTEAVADWPIAPVEEFIKDKPGLRHLADRETSIDPGRMPVGREVWVFPSA
jgi:L-ascorbate metabolism protein UlaG (beta-lactamase superfamily)